jgi:ABC-type taurine transport system ATPase subunit
MTLDIQVAGLQLRYGAVTALDDLSFTLPGGRIYGLLGRNGSGKTSLLSVLAGFRKASGGTVLIDELSPLFEEVVIIDNGRLVLHDETEVLRAWGADVTGPAEAVDRFVAGRTVLRERQLGRTKSAMVYGGLDEHHRRQARDAGLDLGPVALQDLFVHLTQPAGGAP